MRIGIGIGGTVGQSGGLEAQVRSVEVAESDGFDSVWVPHIGGWDALTLIALAGPRTRRIEMMTGVVPVYTRHPALMAQQALTTQAATTAARDGEPRGRDTDDPSAARQTVAQRFKRYGQLINYRRMLDIGGAAGPEEVAIIGNEASVESQLRALAAAGA